MHTVELMQQMVLLAERLGYEVRQEWFGGSGGGACEVKGRKCVFIDLARNSVEQLDQICEAIRTDPGLHAIDIAPPLSRQLGLRRAA